MSLWGFLLLRKAFKPAGPDGERLWWCTDQKALQKIKNDPLRNICGKAQVDLIPTNHVDLDEHTEAYLQ